MLSLSICPNYLSVYTNSGATLCCDLCLKLIDHGKERISSRIYWAKRRISCTKKQLEILVIASFLPGRCCADLEKPRKSVVKNTVYGDGTSFIHADSRLRRN